MKICIDPGHRNSNYDFGATSNGVKESELALQIANLLAEGFKKSGHEVFFTRISENQVISLNKRIKEANKIPYLDYYLSIHINSSTNENASGFEVWHYGNLDTMAQKICSNVCANTDQKNRGAKESTSLAVLNGTYCKAFLIECGFISNAVERALLSKKEYQYAIVNGILKAFDVAPILEQEDVPKQKDNTTEIMLNGVIKKVECIKKDGANYIKLRDLQDDFILVDYNSIAKRPIVKIKNL